MSHQYQKSAVHFIDIFIVPTAAKQEFFERMKMNRQLIKTLPGFINDAAYVNTDDLHEVRCMTIAHWESLEAVTHAKEVVQAEYKKQGFDLPGMLKRLNIQMERRIYQEL